MKNEMPKIPNSNHKLLKKGTKLVLSAATFGVVAAGSFQGVNYVVDNYNKQNTTVQSTNVVKTSSSTTSTISEVAKNCMPSIVSITNVSVSDVQNYFSMYGNNSRSNPFTQQESTSVGSGVIINKKNGEIDILTMLVKADLVASKSEARRAVEQGGVTLDQDKVTDIKAVFAKAILEGDGVILKRGKKNFKRVNA